MTEQKTNQPDKRVQTRWTRIVRLLLVSIVVSEVALYLMMKYLGWNETGQAFLLACSALIIGLPVVCVVAIFVRRKFRFGIRSLLAFMICVAAFFGISAIPFWEFKKARHASMLLQESEIRIDRHVDLRFHLDTHYLDQAWNDPLKNADMRKPVFWIAPFVKELSRIPEDREVQSIFLKSDAECEVFRKYHHTFESVVQLHLLNMSDESLLSLRDILPHHKKILKVYCFPKDGTCPKEFWEMVKENQWPMVGLSVDPAKIGEPCLPGDMNEWDFLRVLVLYRQVSPTQLNQSDIDTLGRCKQLRLLETFGLSLGAQSKIEQTLSNCQIQQH